MDALALLLKLFLSFTSSDAPVESGSCLSTVFGTKGDKWAGGNALYLGRPVRPSVDVGIAHRTLPVGSLVLLQNPSNARLVIAQVIDRGPYGAILKGETPRPGQICRTRKDGRTWCVKRNSKDAGAWRGCIDATPKAAEILGHSGFQRLRFWSIPGTKPKSTSDWPVYQSKQKDRRERIESRKRSS